MGRTSDYQKKKEDEEQKVENANKAKEKAQKAKECFNKRLKSLQENKKLTQSKVEFDTGISRTTFKQYINGKPNMEYSECKIGNLAILANYFNVSTDYLLGITTIKNPDFKVRRISELTGLNENTVSFLVGHIKKRKKKEESETKRNHFPPIPLFINNIINNDSFYNVMKTMDEIIKFKRKIEDNKKNIKKIDNFDEESYFDDIRNKERILKGKLSMDISDLVEEIVNKVVELYDKEDT